MCPYSGEQEEEEKGKKEKTQKEIEKVERGFKILRDGKTTWRGTRKEGEM